MQNKFSNGLTIADLKKAIADLPEQDEFGEDYEVWMATERNLSSIVTHIIPLNKGDILFSCGQYFPDMALEKALKK